MADFRGWLERGSRASSFELSTCSAVSRRGPALIGQRLAPPGRAPARADRAHAAAHGPCRGTGGFPRCSCARLTTTTHAWNARRVSGSCVITTLGHRRRAGRQRSARRLRGGLGQGELSSRHQKVRWVRNPQAGACRPLHHGGDFSTRPAVHGASFAEASRRRGQRTSSLPRAGHPARDRRSLTCMEWPSMSKATATRTPSVARPHE